MKINSITHRFMALGTVITLALTSVSALAQSIDDEVKPKGACVHRMGPMKMCNFITQSYCFSNAFVHGVFYDGITCNEAKSMGYY